MENKWNFPAEIIERATHQVEFTRIRTIMQNLFAFIKSTD
jgi:HD-like signal output (HDOD) protein